MQAMVHFRFLKPAEVELKGKVLVNGDELTDAAAMYYLTYGVKQSSDDAGADPKKGKAGSLDRFKALLNGDVPSGGGPRIGDDEHALREVVYVLLRKAGLKSGPAKKAMVEPEKAVRAMVKDPKNFDRVWKAVVANAKTVANARRAAGSAITLE